MINQDTQTTEIFLQTQPQEKETDSIKNKNKLTIDQQTISDLVILPKLKTQGPTTLQNKLNMGQKDDENQYTGLGKRERFRNEILKLKNAGDTQVDLDRVINIFDVLFKENNDDLIEKLEILYSCTASYTSHYFSFEQFEKDHDNLLFSNLRRGKLIFPDIFNKYID